jgi:sulfite exporter TauE/SafE
MMMNGIMTPETAALMLTAGSIGLFHTLMGPDHYLPFIAMSKSGGWRLSKTVLVTALCGLGHVLGSVVLGLVGVAAGVAVFKLEFVESIRGNIAAWMMMAFGLAYFAWGLRRLWRKKEHTHVHSHESTTHTHTHSHLEEHTHVHSEASKKTYTPWILFLIFVFGPCEPLIPILMYPAADQNFVALTAVTSVFALTTLGTMLAVVIAGHYGLSFVPWQKLARYTPAVAGLTIFACGGVITFLGL